MNLAIDHAYAPCPFKIKIVQAKSGEEAFLNLGRKLTERDVNTRVVRVAPTNVDNFWGFIPKPAIESVQKNVLTLLAIDEAHIHVNGPSVFRGPRKLDKERWDDYNWLSEDEYISFINTQLATVRAISKKKFD